MTYFLKSALSGIQIPQKMQTILTSSIFRLPQIITILLVVLMTPNLSNAQGKLMNKLVSKIAKKAGAANTITISSLDNVVPTIGIASNLDPIEVGTLSQSFFTNWKSGGDQAFVMLSKRN
jgi:hypothetical protein